MPVNGFDPFSLPWWAGNLSARLTDEFIERYVCWREACQDVRSAYDNWRDAEPGDRRCAFFAYGAALDREECAARDYHAITLRLGPPALELARA